MSACDFLGRRDAVALLTAVAERDWHAAEVVLDDVDSRVVALALAEIVVSTARHEATYRCGHGPLEVARAWGLAVEVRQLASPGGHG